MKHTPGPWHVYTGGNFVNVVAEGYEQWIEKNSYLGGPLQIAEMNYRASKNYESTPARAQVNARLIAAAPEMLELLRHALENIQGIEDGKDIPSLAIRDHIRAIIAKAEGR